jgi:hypothetical protein
MKEIKLFGKALNVKTLSPATVNALACSKGMIVHPDCCNDRVYAYLHDIPNRYNSTFYQSVADVVERDRLYLLIDQLMHYASTYGTQYQGAVYVPNDNWSEDEMHPIDFSDCKVIQPITPEEIAEKVREMLYSGIALKLETIEDIFSLVDEFSIELDINSVKNIEAKMFLYKRLGLLPSSPEEMVRYLVFLHTGQTLVIKNMESFRSMISNPTPIEDIVNQFGAEKLASVFFRYKPLFLAMKSPMNAKIINKLRRLANKHHKPFQAGYWETLLQKPVEAIEFMQRLTDLSNIKKVRLIKAIDEKASDMTHKMYIIRNGKTYTKSTLPSARDYSMPKAFLKDSLVESLKSKACKIKLPKEIRLAIPSSEKTFVGNIPFGSYINVAGKNSIFGIVWRGEHGAQDLDLSYLDYNGQKIGWNSYYYSGEQDIVYSGDMTSANPEACEYMFCKNGLVDGIIKVNAYHARENSMFNFFVGKTDADFTVERGHTPTENIIKFKAEMKITGETTLGFYADDKIYFSDLNSGDGRVSRFNSHMQNSIKYFVDTRNTFLYWDEILTLAGFTITDEDYDIDLSSGDIAQMIALLS